MSRNIIALTRVGSFYWIEGIHLLLFPMHMYCGPMFYNRIQCYLLHFTCTFLCDLLRLSTYVPRKTQNVLWTLLPQNQLYAAGKRLLECLIKKNYFGVLRISTYVPKKEKHIALETFYCILKCVLLHVTQTFYWVVYKKQKEISGRSYFDLLCGLNFSRISGRGLTLLTLWNNK